MEIGKRAVENNAFAHKDVKDSFSKLKTAIADGKNINEIYSTLTAESEERRNELLQTCDMDCRAVMIRQLNAATDFAEEYEGLLGVLTSDLSAEQRAQFFKLVETENNKTINALEANKGFLEKGLDLALDVAQFGAREDLGYSNKSTFHKSNLVNKRVVDAKGGVTDFEVGFYKDLKVKSQTHDGKQLDHIPSYAAQKKALENELRRPLTKAEEKELYNSSTVVVLPDHIHKAGRTYGGKNTQEQINNDARDLCGAQCKDLEKHRENLMKSGSSEQDINKMIEDVKNRNLTRGIK